MHNCGQGSRADRKKMYSVPGVTLVMLTTSTSLRNKEAVARAESRLAQKVGEEL